MAKTNLDNLVPAGSAEAPKLLGAVRAGPALELAAPQSNVKPTSDISDVPACEQVCIIGAGQDHPQSDGTKTVRHFRWHLQTAFCAPCRLIFFLKDLGRDFGGYALMAPLQYGVNQGVGLTLANLARKAWFAAEAPRGLGLDGATAGRLVTSASFPWNIKPIIGMLSDDLPLCGYHRTPYVIIVGIAGLTGYLSLGLLDVTAVATVPFIALVNFSVSIPDVMIDGRAAELTGKKPERASDLQSLQWGSFALGGVISACVSGWLVETVEARMVFLICILATLSILVPSTFGCLGDQRVLKSERSGATLTWFRENRSLTFCAVIMSSVALLLSVLQVFVRSVYARFGISISCAMLVVTGVFFTLRRISPKLAKTAVFIFLRNAAQPRLDEAVFQWQVKAEDGPKFTLTFLGFVDAIGYLGLFTGIVLYQRYLTNVSYKRIFGGAQVILVMANLLDLVLIKRWNVEIGLPDELFLVGDTIFTETMRRFFDMPMLVLAAQVCPQSIEATLFAMLMSLSNMGDAIGNFLGTTVLELLDVTDCDYGGDGNMCSNLDVAVIIKSLCRCLPILLIPFLVPKGSPAAQSFACGESKEESAAAGGGNEKTRDAIPVQH